MSDAKKLTPNEQVERWVAGESICPNVAGECCPDFSCCTGNLAPLIEREAFARAHKDGDERTRMRMLMGFLGNAFSAEAIHIVDTEAHEGVTQ